MTSFTRKPTIEDLDNILTSYDVYLHLMTYTPARGEDLKRHKIALEEAKVDVARLSGQFLLDDIRSGFAKNPAIAYPKELNVTNIDSILSLIEEAREYYGLNPVTGESFAKEEVLY